MKGTVGGHRGGAYRTFVPRCSFVHVTREKGTSVKRKLLAAVALLALAVAAFLPAGASAYWETCQSNPRNLDQLVGVSVDDGASGGSTTRGISATINPDVAEMRLCKSAGTGDDGTFAGIGLTPGLGNTHYGEAAQGVLFGVGACDNTSNFGMCESSQSLLPPLGNPAYHIFIGIGGCSGSGGDVRNPSDLGTLDASAHDFKIEHVSSPSSAYKFYVDGVSKYTLQATDSRVSCWIGQGAHGGMIEGRTWDVGDGLGDPNSATIVSAVRFRDSDGTPNVSPNWSTNAICDIDDSDTTAANVLDLKCDISNSVHDQVYLFGQAN